tara:strand:+ start:238 stop:1038 length:801 start_codon:yes stop_codon:yes gene_type:complete
MNIFNTLILSGKVIILIAIILIFSLVNTRQAQLDKKKLKNTPEDEDFSILEGYTNKMKENANSEYFDGTCKIKISWPIYLFFKLLGYLLYGLNWLWVNLLRDPVAQLLEKALGEYYGYIKKTFSLIFKFYKLIIKYTFKIIKVVGKIIYKVIDIFFRILFRILDIVPIIKDILAYILAIPFLIFAPLYEFFSGFGKYFAIICWSDNGFVNDVSSFLGLIDVDELEESASFEEDVETSAKNTKKDIDEANKEAEEDAEELKDDAENF